MKLTVFKAGDGDCLLIEGADTNVLVDGGRKTQFKKHVCPTLEAMHVAGKVLDLVCVSHNDDDHITGIVELYRRRTEWAVHSLGTTDEPDFPEPPLIKRLWHNSLEVVLNEVDGDSTGGASGDGNAGIATGNLNLATAQNQLSFHEQLLELSPELLDMDYAHQMRRIAQGARQAIELELRFLQSPMNIEFNGPSNGELLKVGDDALKETIGSMNLHVLTPFQEDFERLRTSWDKWVKDNEDKIKEMREEFAATNDESDAMAFLEFAALKAKLGAFSSITPANLASITFLMEEDGKRILMTGDHASDGQGDSSKRGILEGLSHAGMLADADSGLHFDVMKIPHHGASANTSVEFARRITADHYVFCSNGSHHNPELDVIEAYVNSRLSADDSIRSQNPEAGKRFKLWFNYSPDDSEVKAKKETRLKQMTAVKEKVVELSDNEDLFDFEFCTDSSFTIDLNSP